MREAVRDRRSVVFVGVAAQDTIALVDRFPRPDERVVAREIVHAGGGPAATAAVAAARLGIGASFVGLVGDDRDGERVVAELEAERVDVGRVRREGGVPTATSLIIVDAANGTRAIVNRPGPPLDLADDGCAAELLRAARWVHVDQVGYRAVRALAEPGLPGRLSIDAGNPIPGLDLEGVALFVPTLERLLAFTGEREPGPALRSALASGAHAVVATAGEHGAFAGTHDGRLFHVPAHTAPIRSTLGAGDVFHGALLAGIVRGFALEEAVAYASIAAAFSCRALDGRSAIPTHDEAAAALPALVDRIQPLA